MARAEKTRRFLVALLPAALPLAAGAQSVLELRGATTEYRFVDLAHTFASGLFLDLLYLGAPGSNELYAGAGRSFRPAQGVTLVPIVYGVAARENGERGLAVCASVFVDRGGWRVLGFGGRFFRLSGEVPDYTFLDSLDLTRVVAGRFELGVSAGFLRSGGGWNELIGGTVKLNDKKGTTALALRGGHRSELRLIRTFVF